MNLFRTLFSVNKKNQALNTTKNNNYGTSSFKAPNGNLEPQENQGALRKEPYNIIISLNDAQKYCFQKFINLCMKNGKKNKARNIISKTLRDISLTAGSAKFHQNSPGNLVLGHTAGVPGGPTSQRVRKGDLCFEAVENIKPIIETRRVRISGTTQLVPSIIPRNRQQNLAIRWILEAALLRRKTKKNMTLNQCILIECLDASQNIGNVKKRRDDLHKQAESNRGFAHYRWW